MEKDWYSASSATLSDSAERNLWWNPESENSTSGVETRAVRLCKLTSDHQTIPSGKLSNWNAYLYAGLFRAIRQMSELPGDDDLHLEPDAARRASAVLGFVKEQIDVVPPKLINQDKEAVSFTWDLGRFKKYLTVSDDEIDLMILASNPAIRCEEVVSEEGDIDFERLLNGLVATPRTATTEF